MSESKQEIRDAAGRMDEMWGERASVSSAACPGAEWFVHDKYSMFIHWGLYSMLGGEWEGKTYDGIGEWIMHPRRANIPVVTYKGLARQFNPVDFDARAIARLAREAGMRCIVITAKHHEGFAMFDSKASDFTITQATPFGRDVMREMADACRAEGLRLGFYYSQFQDWSEPDGGGSMCKRPQGSKPDFNRYFDEKVIPQVTELLTNYGPIAVVWFDTPGTMGSQHSQRLVDLVHELQPDCLVNSRVGNGLGDYSTLGDMEIPTTTPQGGLFECIDTTNDSWSFARTDSNWKSPTKIAQTLVRTIARGCSFMLNVGPTGEGTIPGLATAALRGAGRWIAANDEAIYGTTASPFPPFSWGDCTVKGSCLYACVFEWPRSGKLRIPALGGRVEDVQLPGSGERLPFSQSADCLELQLTPKAPDPMITVIRITLAAPPTARYQDLPVDGEFPASLPAEYADVQGVALKAVSWMEAFGGWKKSEHLTGWRDDDSCKATWALNILAPGIYSVTVEYACTPENEGSEWQLKTDNGEDLVFRAFDTGFRPDHSPGGPPRMRYRAVEQGVLQFKASGRQKLDMVPRPGGTNGDIQVRQIILTPWK